MNELIKFLCLDSLVVLNFKYGFNLGWINFLDVILLNAVAQPVNRGLEFVDLPVVKTSDVVATIIASCDVIKFA